ncbi:hypothetical protein H310_02053 [Aphanomyces invadans]|uniref:protein O-GlcNAc transferase n=1 Tax=Aphanomyces invadans TaxID=157072 RepID=A0A024UM84_9STRA|nr:hypothetical protein H310_02053 [Aphanomyces invadans]ETW07566.1 hypothetical protein H310_02053 [Aphanomyces invadans]|eukprot:XP_008863659.1 hypothetical protein H310_02053 [Aphanomyces invadans]
MMRWTAAVVAVLAACSVCVSKAASTVSERFHDAIQILQSGDTATAENLLLRLSKVAPDDVDVHLALGAMHQLEGDVESATKYYNTVLALDPANDAVHANLACLYYSAGFPSRAIEHFKASVATNPSKAQGMAHMIALAHHSIGDDVAAIALFDLALPLHDNNAHFHFDFAVSLQDEGLAMRANEEYNRALATDPDFPEAWLNIATLHLRHGSYSSALRNFERALRCTRISPTLSLQIAINYGVALEANGQAMAALAQFKTARSLVESMEHVEAIDLFEHTTRTRRAIALWVDYEATWDAFIDATISRQLNRGAVSSLVPFSSLLVDLPPPLRKRIAEAYASTPPRSPPLDLDRRSNTSRVHVGYLSFDFNNHPTAHLMEGLFVHHNTSAFEVSAWSYGKDDGSAYRQSIPSLTEHFVDVVLMGTNDAAAAIERARVEILVDAQGHTLGQRHAIVAAQPAPIIVNFLVYPGTLGAKYVDYLVSDVHVTPAEHAEHYTERLMLLPQSYQVNYYATYGAVHDPTPRPLFKRFAFANFNKLDKIEPQVFGVWMAVMRRVPFSELWLLHPTSSNTRNLIVANIVREAAQHGIAASRIRFLPRVSKADHLRRQRHADLFLDTFVYGAHSTATDALAGSLPVLTLAGSSFPSRVGVSLLQNANMPWLVVHTAKEFEDLAVRLATQRHALRHIVDTLDTLGPSTGVTEMLPLFRTDEYTLDLERMYRMSVEARQHLSSRHHLVLPRRHGPTN